MSDDVDIALALLIGQLNARITALEADDASTAPGTLLDYGQAQTTGLSTVEVGPFEPLLVSDASAVTLAVTAKVPAGKRGVARVVMDLVCTPFAGQNDVVEAVIGFRLDGLSMAVTQRNLLHFIPAPGGDVIAVTLNAIFSNLAPGNHVIDAQWGDNIGDGLKTGTGPGVNATLIVALFEEP